VVALRDARGHRGVVRLGAAHPTGYVAAGAEICAAAAGTGTGVCPSLVLTSSDGRVWFGQASPEAGPLQELTLVADRLLAIAPDGPATLWTSSDGSAWSAVAVAGAPSMGARPGGLVSYSHLASSSVIAVMVGSDPTGRTLEAWYREAAP
jgi:hypothetical protein